MGISLLIPNVLAVEFSIDSPENVNTEEEFEVSIELNEETSDVYDVKIFVYSNEMSNIVSEIYYEDEWKNPFYYLQDVFPDKGEYKIRVNDFSGETEICVRLRIAEQTSYVQVCNDINVKESETEENPDDEQSEDDSDEEIITGNNVGKVSLTINKNPENEIVKVSDERNKIVLNSPIANSKDDDEKFFLSKDEKMRRGIVFVFLGFTVLLIVLLAFRRL